MVTAVAPTEGDLLMWRGLVESRIRILLKSIEKLSAIELAYINPQSYLLHSRQRKLIQMGQEDHQMHLKGVYWFIGLHFDQIQDNHESDIMENIQEFRNLVLEQLKGKRKNRLNLIGTII